MLISLRLYQGQLKNFGCPTGKPQLLDLDLV